MEKVLVLGGTQFFGKRLVELLLKAGKKVTIATRGLKPDPFGDKIERLVIDREKKETLIEAFKYRTWDLVYDQTCYSPLEALEALEALKGKVNRYIFTSTMAVYDFGTNHKEEDFNSFDYTFNFKERRDYQGFSGYQEAKRASENVIFTQKELEAVAVRFPIVIGEDDYTERLKFHVTAVSQGDPIGISNLDNRYGFITSKDAAEFLFKIGLSSYKGPINAGCKGDLSLQELIRMIEKTTGQEAIIEKEWVKENVSPYSLGGSWSINTDKANALGFHFVPLKPTVEELIVYYLSNESNLQKN